jgi:hypothetical protein
MCTEYGYQDEVDLGKRFVTLHHSLVGRNHKYQSESLMMDEVVVDRAGKVFVHIFVRAKERGDGIGLQLMKCKATLVERRALAIKNGRESGSVNY